MFKLRYLLIIFLLISPFSFALVCDYSEVEAEYVLNNEVYNADSELKESFNGYCNDAIDDGVTESKSVSTNANSKSNTQFTSIAAKTITAPFFAAGFVLIAPTAFGYSLMDSKSESSTLSPVGMGAGATVFIVSIPLAMAGFILALPAIPFWFLDK